MRGKRQDSPPFLAEITYELSIDADEDARRLELMHHNVQKYGTIFNTMLRRQNWRVSPTGK
jgi:hypothetical protein